MPSKPHQMSAHLSPAVVIGYLVTLWGSLVLTIGMSEGYERRRKWRRWLNEVGTLVVVLGTAIAIGASVFGATSVEWTRFREQFSALVARPRSWS